VTAAIVNEGRPLQGPRAFHGAYLAVRGLTRRLGGDGGQTVTEYGIVLGILLPLLVAAVVILLPGVQAVVKAAADNVAGILS
jgi:hypothetical protein